MEASRVTKTVNFPCGCIGEYVHVGDQSHFTDEAGKRHKQDWHVVNCRGCAVNRQPGVLERRAQEAWDKAQPVATVVEG